MSQFIQEKMQQELHFEILSAEARRWEVNSNNPECPFSKFIGNDRAIRRLGRAAFKAMSRKNRACNDLSFALVGPASTGKTTLAEMYANLIGIPFVDIQPQSVDTVQDVFEEIRKVLSKPVMTESGPLDISLVEIGEHNHYVIPPCVVFIDEVHNLKKKVVQGLLKATEKKDATMVTEDGIIANTGNVAWMIATTDRGKLFDAFDTRFEKLQLRLYSKDEIAQIINLANSDWTKDICDVVARYCSVVPREALTFATEMRNEAEMTESSNWNVVAATVANDQYIDEFGMTHQRVSILKALGNRPISAKQLPTRVRPRVKEEELEKFVLPPLMVVTPDQTEPLVTVTSKGYTITHAGLSELDKRGIPNMGEEAIPESIRETIGV